MSNLKEIAWYQTFDWSMIWVCTGAVLVLALYLEIYGSKEVISGKSGDKIRNNRWLKYTYHLTSSILMLTFITEIGYNAIKPLLGISIDAEGDLLHFLSALCGLGGGYVVAKLIRLIQKLK